MQRICILEFIDQYVPVARSERVPHHFVVAQQGASGEDQIVKVEQGTVALVAFEIAQHRLQQIGQPCQRLAGKQLLEVQPGVLACAVMAGRHRSQRIAICIFQAHCLHSIPPLAFHLEGLEAALLGKERGGGVQHQAPCQRDVLVLVGAVVQPLHHDAESIGDSAGDFFARNGAGNEAGERTCRLLKRRRCRCQRRIIRAIVARGMPQFGGHRAQQRQRRVGVVGN